MDVVNPLLKKKSDYHRAWDHEGIEIFSFGLSGEKETK